ncbi:MAG TPA: cyclase family protein [Steroidobacter sp.]|uniref:cyclase family protein n=1 Tax=Steroidobacter sp. TaxID=1978227 RepID=UPI002ED7ECB6
MRQWLIGLALFTAVLGDSVRAEQNDWYPSRYGAEDSLGAINNLSAAKVLQAARLVKTGKTYALGVPTGPDTPTYPPREYSITVLQLDDGTGKPVGSNHVVSNDDLLITWMGIGSQIDGLGHAGIDHRYYNGVPAGEFIKPNGLTRFSVHTLPPIVTRGVLLDMAKHLGKQVLEPGTAINRAQIEAASKAQGVRIERGDVVLLHTGWLNVADSDPQGFMKGEPGLGLEGARYLASLGVVAVGADNWALEAVPSEEPGVFFPVHPELLAKNGTYILETMDTRALAADGVYEFLFVLGQPRFVGSAQTIINPVAIR